jgi:hypothetical protein
MSIVDCRFSIAECKIDNRIGLEWRDELVSSVIEKTKSGRHKVVPPSRRGGSRVGCSSLSRQKQLNLVEGSDQFATGDQFFERRAILQLLVVNETLPEIWGDCAEGGLTEEIEG